MIGRNMDNKNVNNNTLILKNNSPVTVITYIYIAYLLLGFVFKSG